MKNIWFTQLSIISKIDCSGWYIVYFWPSGFGHIFRRPIKNVWSLFCDQEVCVPFIPSHKNENSLELKSLIYMFFKIGCKYPPQLYVCNRDHILSRSVSLISRWLSRSVGLLVSIWDGTSLAPSLSWLANAWKNLEPENKHNISN